MKSFLRDNLMIVASVALPLLVLVLFAAASIIPNWLTDPPAYDLVMTRGFVNRNTAPIRIDLNVEGDRLVARIVKAPDVYGGLVPRIFLFTAETQEVREVRIPLPANFDALQNGDELPIPELAGLRLDGSGRSPDGWELEGARSGGGLFTELFGGGGNRYQARLVKNGAVVRLRFPGESGYFYGELILLGWVLK